MARLFGITKFDADMTELGSLERSLGLKAKHDIVHIGMDWYRNYGTDGSAMTPNSFPVALCNRIVNDGRRAQLNMRPQCSPTEIRHPKQTLFKLSKIVAGNYDSYIRNYLAIPCKNFGKEVIIALMPEMTGTWHAYRVEVQDGEGNYNTKAEFVAAWRRIVNIFRDEGAINAKWSFPISNNYAQMCQRWDYNLEEIYPGDNYVDILAQDCYTMTLWRGWRSFEEMVNGVQVAGWLGPYDALAALSPNKRIWLKEYGCATDPRRPEWFRGMKTTLLAGKFPRLEGMVWSWYKVDEDRNYLIEDSESRVAYKEMVDAVRAAIIKGYLRVHAHL